MFVNVLGRVVSTLTSGDEDYTTTSRALETCVTNFNSALSHYGHSVGFKTFEYVEGEQTWLCECADLLDRDASKF